MPKWMRLCCFVACVPLITLFGLAELKYLQEDQVYLGCFCIFLQCVVGVGLLVMVFKWWPPKR